MIRSTWFWLARHDEPTDPAPATGAPAPTSQPDPSTKPGPDPSDPVDVDSLPANVKNMIAQLRREAAKNRTDPKAAAEQARLDLAQQIGKALGLTTGDEPPDPAALTAQIEEAQAVAWRNGTELIVHRIAAQLGADPEALLDSNAFIDDLDDLTEVDPRSAEFRQAVEAKVKAAVERSPKKYALAPTQPAGPRPDPSQGRTGSSQPTDFRKASKEDVAAEMAKLGLRPRW